MRRRKPLAIRVHYRDSQDGETLFDRELVTTDEGAAAWLITTLASPEVSAIDLARSELSDTWDAILTIWSLRI